MQLNAIITITMYNNIMMCGTSFKITLHAHKQRLHNNVFK